ncbi:MAG: nitroreductase family protein [Dehalococcoidia bacterium]
MQELIVQMEIPHSRWHGAIARRRSRRRFDSAELESNLVDLLEAICKDFRPFSQARAQLVTRSPDTVFKGAVGPYGKIKGAPAYIAFIGDMDDPHIPEEIGYLGEGIILEATAMGLATCWVGGFFRPKVAASAVGTGGSERVFAVTPVGHALAGFSAQERIMTGFGRSHRRKPLAELVTGLKEEDFPPWVKAALEAARLAPSAINRQPWRFQVTPESITVAVDNRRLDFGISTRLDCGIAMLHIEVAALDCGVQGRWEPLEAPKVARFIVTAEK